MNKNEIISNIDKAICAAHEAIEAGEKMKAELLKVKDDWWTERGFDKKPQVGEWVEVWDEDRGISMVLRFEDWFDGYLYPARAGRDQYKNIAPAKLPREKLGLWVGVLGTGLKYVINHEPFMNGFELNMNFPSGALRVIDGSKIDKLTAHLKPGEKMEI